MNWWEESYGFFDRDYLDNFEPLVDEESTKMQVEFIIKALEIPPGSKILDLAGGMGRHSIELALKGFQCVLLDINTAFLNKARELAKQKDVNIEIINRDMREIDYCESFDGVISMSTSFGYFSNDEDHFRVINSVFKSLRRGGKFLLDLDNRERIIKFFKKYEWFKVKDTFVLRNAELDLYENRIKENIVRICLDKRNVKEHFITIRMFTLNEIKTMVERGGFNIIQVFGNYDFSNYNMESYRMILLSQKS